MKFRLIAWIAAACAVCSFAVAAPAQQASLAVGSDYVVIDPVIPPDNPAKIEVTEYFSLACPHCKDLNPLLQQWVAKLPADVEFKKVPVPGFNPFYMLMARLYYTLEVLGELPRLESVAFRDIHEKGLRLIDDKSIAQWATSQGIDARKFSEAYNSFGVQSKVRRADDLAKKARIDGVPSLVVDGRYRVVGQNIKGHDELLTLADRVIDKARSERNGKKK